MIQEGVICDICGVEKKEANHWFLAYEQKGTLKISAWGVLNRKHPSMKHLCGQRCVHRFIDDFLAGQGMTDSPDTHASVAETAPSDDTVEQKAEVPVR